MKHLTPTRLYSDPHMPRFFAWEDAPRYEALTDFARGQVLNNMVLNALRRGHRLAVILHNGQRVVYKAK